MLSLLLAACSTERPIDHDRPSVVDPERTSTPGTTTLVSRCATGDSDCFDMLTVPLTWTLEAPWTGLRIGGAGDIDGDGIDDAMVTMWIEQEGADISHTSFLFGPLDRTRSLPSGEDLGLSGDWRVGDITLDGVADLVQEGGAVLAGPVDATTTEADSLGTVPDDLIMDLDGDGDLDLSKGTEDRIELWLGLWTGWYTESPTTTLLVEQCDPDGYRAQAWPVADLDLDGIGEWWVAAAWGCPHYQVPANTVGVVDVSATFPLATWQYPTPVGDQSGDGFPDHRVVTANGPEVLAAPMSFDFTTGWTGVSLGAQAEVEGNAPSPLGQSVIGDGFQDFALDIEDGLTLFAGGGPNSDAFTGTVTRTLLGPNLSFSAGFVISVDDARTSARVAAIPADW